MIISPSAAPGSKQLKQHYISDAEDSMIHDPVEGVHVDTSVCDYEQYKKTFDIFAGKIKEDEYSWRSSYDSDPRNHAEYIA